MAVLRPFVVETAGLTPFFTTSDFACALLDKVAGGVFYAASLMQSCFARPWLGTLLLCLLLVALPYTLRWAMRIDRAWEGLCWMPSMALLLNYTQTGYMVYLLKSPAVAFTAPVGLLLAMLLVAAWVRLPDWRARALWTLLAATAGYWLMGVYALLACALAALDSLAEWGRTRGRRPLLLAAGIAVCALLAPRLLHALGLFMMRAEDLYVAGLPDYRWDAAERPMFYPLAAAFAVPALLMLLRRVAPRGRAAWATMALFAVSACAAWHFTFRDEAFLAILRMKHAAERGDYEAILDESRQATHEPTRTEVMFTRLALYKTGQMGETLFRFPDGNADYRAPRPNQWMRLVAARQLYYLYGKVNYAYRWSMEDMVEYGRRPECLECMAKCAVVNGERQLALKYIEALRHTLWHRDFAERLLPYAEGRKRAADDAEMAAIQPLLQYRDVLDGDGGMIEVYLLNSFALSEGGSRDIVELSLVNNLIMKDLRAAWPRLMMLLPTWEGRIPRHYQEAALLIGQFSGGQADTSRLPIDDDVRRQFGELIEASAQSGDDAANAQALRPRFGGTYWYYYFFVNGLKTN